MVSDDAFATAFAIYNSTYPNNKLNPETRRMWERKLQFLNEVSFMKAIESLTGSETYAFRWLKVMQIARDIDRGGNNVATASAPLPPHNPRPQWSKDMRDAENLYKRGAMSFEDLCRTWGDCADAGGIRSSMEGTINTRLNELREYKKREGSQISPESLSTQLEGALDSLG